MIVQSKRIAGIGDLSDQVDSEASTAPFVPFAPCRAIAKLQTCQEASKHPRGLGGGEYICATSVQNCASKFWRPRMFECQLMQA